MQIFLSMASPTSAMLFNGWFNVMNCADHRLKTAATHLLSHDIFFFVQLNTLWTPLRKQ